MFPLDSLESLLKFLDAVAERLAVEAVDAAAPRDALKNAGLVTVEMPRNSAKSFCCGAGGAQMWKEEEAGTSRVNVARFAEAKWTGANTVAVGCPFCLTMLTDSAKAQDSQIQVKDVAELVAQRMK